MHLRLKKGVLIAFEGIDGAGKSTQAHLLYERLKKANFPVVISREPTEGKWGKKLKGLIKQGENRLMPQKELEMFLKDRYHHIKNIVCPALKSNQIIILDRYYFSNIAYQGALGIPTQLIEKRNREFAPEPNLLFLIEIPPEIGIKRIEAMREGGIDFFEKEEYLNKVSEIFYQLNKPFFHRLRGEDPVEKLSQRIWEITLNYLTTHDLIIDNSHIIYKGGN